MPSLNCCSIKIDAEEPETFCRVPTSVAIFLLQVGILGFFGGMAVLYKEPQILILVAIQAVITIFFIFDVYFVIFLHLLAQCLGLFVIAAKFVEMLIELYTRNLDLGGLQETVGFLWVGSIAALIHVYYFALVVRYFAYLTKKAADKIMASAPHEESIRMYSNEV